MAVFFAILKGYHFLKRFYKHSILYLFISIFLIPGELCSSYRQAPEDLIKAAYIYKFISFISWPDIESSNTGGNFVIGILGDKAFADNFKEIEGRSIAGMDKTIQVLSLGTYQKNFNFASCYILFVSATEKSFIKDILNETKNIPVLTISDAEDFIEEGGIIQLITVNGQIRWELNLTAAKKSSLKLSATLIQSAVKVITDTEEKR